MPDNETGSPRKPRGTRKASPERFADDWPSVEPAGASDASAADAAPARQRVAKAMARAGLCSRRDAEAWILEGRVSVNGERLTSPARDIGPDDHVEVDGAALPSAEKTRLFLFHKPRGLVTSDHDPEGRETIFDHLHRTWPQGPRVVTIGRLDINTEGLLLLTNDGGLARMLELPKTGWLRRYRVRANGETDQAQLDALAAGITIEGVDYAGIEAKLDRTQGANCWLTMGLREGKNREVKRVLEHLGLEVNRLIRLSFGPFQLLDLEEGAVEEVRTRVLKDQLGAALAAEAGVDFGESSAPVVAPRAARENTANAKTAPIETDHARPERAKPERVRPERGAAPTREKRGRAGDPRPQQSRANEARAGDRTLRRPAAPSSMAGEERSRPRRHVSTLRTTEAEAARSGPRKRVERTDTRDRHDRKVAVERKVAARPPGLSPSAEGKRARIARSGGRRDDTNEAMRSERGEARPARSGDRPQRTRGAAAPGADRRDARPSRPSDGGDRPVRRPREDRAASGGGDRPQRSRAAGGEERRDARPPRSTSGGDRREARPPRSTAGGDRPPRAAPAGRNFASKNSASKDSASKDFASRGERPARAPRSPRRDESGGRDASTSGKPPGAGRGARGAAPGKERAAGKGPYGVGPGAVGRIAGKGKPAGGGRPGGRAPAGGKPSGARSSGARSSGAKPSGGKPPRGGAPGRGKR